METSQGEVRLDVSKCDFVAIAFKIPTLEDGVSPSLASAASQCTHEMPPPQAKVEAIYYDATRQTKNASI
jgi:hypothetical protein